VTAVELPEKGSTTLRTSRRIRQTFQPDGKNAIWRFESSQPRHGFVDLATGIGSKTYISGHNGDWNRRSTQLFTSFYLLGHGVIKIVLIVGLLREKLGYYPAAIAVFVLFVMYQIYRYTFTHSIWLLLITLLDIVVIWLTWHEYTYMRDHRPAVSSTRSGEVE
jgi:hypothetical protein